VFIAFLGMKCHLETKVPRKKHSLEVFQTGGCKEYLDLRGRKWQEAGKECSLELDS
jgi:hypothetical protein